MKYPDFTRKAWGQAMGKWQEKKDIPYSGTAF